ncbi:AcrR family transcriptional regulator [Marmoricola sp. OAE513]|uniref:TetR/AcrR family transcriptional regulator n=1 Tax=Marmoricola sp. OAE513 TaxID=2817894 RepID=UPI001AE2D204
MVERILDAATRVLATGGYVQMSTNRVADEADVSIGSLYRYFRDKDEIIAELQQRASTGIVEEITAAMADAAPMDAYAGTRHVVATIVASLRARGPLISAMINEVPLGSHSNALPEVERNLGAFVRMYAVQRAPRMPREELDARVYLAMGITLSSCLRIALEKPEHLDAEHLIDLTAGMLALGLTAHPA